MLTRVTRVGRRAWRLSRVRDRRVAPQHAVRRKQSRHVATRSTTPARKAVRSLAWLLAIVVILGVLLGRRQAVLGLGV